MIDNLVMAPLEVILPNPFQPRQSEDPEHVKNLAVSIAEKGLKQIPVGRIVDKVARIAWVNVRSWQNLLEGDLQEVLKQTGWQVQLACGHSRLAAFRLLKEAGNKGFDCMPVMLDDLDDAGMFETALIENVQRRNLTPVEEATAMKRLRDEFNLTSPEIGKLFGLGDSAVRNKIRLLNLPEELRQKLSEHLLSESAARALLELFDLPEDLRQSAEKSSYYDNCPTNIIKAALEGETAENILAHISSLIRSYSHDLSKATWKWDEVFTGDVRLVGPCKGCQYLVKNDKKSLCIKTSCFMAKDVISKQRYLDQASQISGIKVQEGDSDTSLTKFHYNSNAKALELAKSIKCPNLRLIYDEYEYHEDDDHLKSIGFPRAQIVCGKQQQWCSCSTAVKSGLQDILIEKVAPPEKAAEPEYIPVGDSADPGDPVIPSTIPVTLDQLKEVSRAARQQKKQNIEEIKGLGEEAAKIIANGLINITNPKIWLVILDTMDWSDAKDIERDSKGDYSDNPVTWCDEIRYLIGKALINKTVIENYYYSEPDPELTLKRLNEYLKKAGLRELETVSAETVEVT